MPSSHNAVTAISRSSSVQFDCIILGAGIIGTSAALHLQATGRQVALFDRNRPGEEASYGNAGLIERSSVIPYAFPRDLGTLLRYAFNRSCPVRYDLLHLIKTAPWLLRYWHASRPSSLMKIAHDLLPLIEASLTEHDAFIAASGQEHLVQRDGWIEIFRSQSAMDHALTQAQALQDFGLSYTALAGPALRTAEPSLKNGAIGGLHWQDPYSISDPGALTKGYAALFEQRGGSIHKAGISALQKDGDVWQLQAGGEVWTAREIVVALGAQSGIFLAQMGLKTPLVAKRGYHMHFSPCTDQSLNHAVLDEEYGFVLAPMQQGIRLTTGVELAAPDAPINERQLALARQKACDLIDLGKPVETQPWLGLRSAMPDMKPVIGPVPARSGLWCAYGHAHHGLTLGPVTGRFLAQMMSGEEPLANPSAFAFDRF